MYHLRFCFILKEVLRFFTANLQKRVLWNSARSHLLHTITPAICGFRNLRYFARSQNQQNAGFYCTLIQCLGIVPVLKYSALSHRLSGVDYVVYMPCCVPRSTRDLRFMSRFSVRSLPAMGNRRLELHVEPSAYERQTA